LIEQNQARNRQAYTVLSIACGLAFMAVVFGAFGGHGLANHLDQLNRLATFETANKYHFYHSIALFLIGLLMKLDLELPKLRLASIIMMLGILLFSGSLYVLAVTDIGWFGAITPLGGLCFLLSWFISGFVLWDARSRMLN
jgi:uncharacterized membrane protein YgdD (TMEM256/DUF423 family)